MSYTFTILKLLLESRINRKGLEDNVKTHAPHTAGLGEQAGIALFSQWNEFCDLREIVLRRGDSDSIHDLRVASRRMRATVGLFAPFIAGKTVKRTSKMLRRVTRELGRLRNIDEAMIYFGAVPERLPVLCRLLPAVRKEEIKVVTDILRPLPRQEMDRVLREAVADLAGVPHDDPALPAYLADLAAQRFQAVQGLLSPATIPENREGRHGLRIAIKKWRYLLETIGLVSGQDFGAALETLKEYQTVLGNLNDMVEFGALCDTLGLPAQERKRITAALARDSGAYLARFVDMTASRPLQYTQIL